MSNVNVVLAHKLDILDKYLRLEANELIFTKSCEFFVDYGDRWERIVDEKLDYEFLTSFLQQLATRRHQRFNEKYPSLSCELPPPYLRYRVQAQHESILFNSDVSICIRIPSNKRFELESFKLSDKLIQQGWNYDLIRQFIRDKKNVLVSGGTGSGKTSFLNSLMGEIPKEDRVVTIEDSQELFIENENRTQIAIPKEEGSKVAKFANAIGKGAVAVAKETKDLIIGKGQDHELDLAKESDDLNKALDNIVKTHSLADFVRALYTLDKALYQMGEAQEKPADKPLMKEMLNDLEKGKPLTKETAEKALEEMQNSKEKLDNFILQREKELNNKQALEKTIEKYNAEKSMNKKTEYATNINDRLKYIDEYLPSFKENEKNTLEKAKDTLKKHEHEKSMVKQKDLGFMGKGRER